MVVYAVEACECFTDEYREWVVAVFRLEADAQQRVALLKQYVQEEEEATRPSDRKCPLDPMFEHFGTHRTRYTCKPLEVL